MARAVERALERAAHLIVEAGTGTGKTLAYLLPALRTGQRVIISTGTKNLQEQLFFKDIPFLESLLGPLRVCYMKGRANYLCRHKLYALRDQPILNGLEEIDQYQQDCGVGEGRRRPATASELAELPETSALWHEAGCAQRGVPGADVPGLRAMLHHGDAAQGAGERHHDREPSPVFCRSGDQAAGAEALRMRAILPEAAVVIFDEAHELEDVASSYFGRRPEQCSV